MKSNPSFKIDSPYVKKIEEYLLQARRESRQIENKRQEKKAKIEILSTLHMHEGFHLSRLCNKKLC